MADIDGFYKPELALLSKGNRIDYNKLTLNSSAAGLFLKIDFSQSPQLAEGSLIKGQFSLKGEEPEDLFTSLVEDISPSGGMTFRLVGRESSYKKLSVPLTPTTWRKSNLKEILSDLFDITTIQDFDIRNCSDIPVSRFSIPAGDTGFQVLTALINMLRFSTGDLYIYRPSPTGALVFGPTDKTLHKRTETISLESGVNIISWEGLRIRTFALPVLFHQIIEVDGEKRLCSKSTITARSGKYRLDIEVAQT